MLCLATEQKLPQLEVKLIISAVYVYSVTDRP